MLDRASRLGARPSLPSPLQLLTLISTLLGNWERRARERRILAEMDDRMLKDVGLTRTETVRESVKPFWNS